MEVANNSHFLDLQNGQVSIVQHLGGGTLEMKYFLRDDAAVATFLANARKHANEVQYARDNLLCSKVLCRFDFGNYEPDLRIQENLIDFQNGIFDEITVQMVGDDVSTFEKVLQHAYKHKAPISTLGDLKWNVLTLGALLQVIRKRSVSSTRWKYRKITTYIGRYRLVSQQMREAGIPYDLTACNKRCSAKNFEDVAVSIVARGFFGFRSCCLDYKAPMTNKGRKRFSPHTDVFNDATYLWEKQVNSKKYQDTRMDNFVKLDKASVSSVEIARRPKVKDLFDYLRTL